MATRAAPAGHPENPSAAYAREIAGRQAAHAEEVRDGGNLAEASDAFALAAEWYKAIQPRTEEDEAALQLCDQMAEMLRQQADDMDPAQPPHPSAPTRRGN